MINSRIFVRRFLVLFLLVMVAGGMLRLCTEEPEAEVDHPAPQSIVPYISEALTARYTGLAGPVRTAVWGRLDEANWYSDAAEELEAVASPVSGSAAPAESQRAVTPRQSAAQPGLAPKPVPESTQPVFEPPAPAQSPQGALTAAEVGAAARAVGWPESQIETVIRVAKCESGLRTTAVGALGEQGLMQVRPEYHGSVPADSLGQLAQALRIWKAQGWIPWSCR